MFSYTKGVNKVSTFSPGAAVSHVILTHKPLCYNLDPPHPHPHTSPHTNTPILKAPKCSSLNKKMNFFV